MVPDRVQQSLDDDGAQCAASPSDDLDCQEATVSGKGAWLIEPYSLRVELHGSISIDGRFVRAHPAGLAGKLLACGVAFCLRR